MYFFNTVSVKYSFCYHNSFAEKKLSHFATVFSLNGSDNFCNQLLKNDRNTIRRFLHFAVIQILF